MLDKLIQLVRDNAGEAILNNTSIPADRKEEAIKETGSAIVGTLQQAMATNATEVLGMLTRGNTEGAGVVVQQVSGALTERLQDRFGLSLQQASATAGGIVPQVMEQMAKKAADPADPSFDAQDLIRELSGGKADSVDIQGLLNRMKAGMDKDGDGDVDLEDLKRIFSSGSTAVVDKLKNLFK